MNTTEYTTEHTKFKPFDFYRTEMDFCWRNPNEEYLKLSDYGITREDVFHYKQLIEDLRAEAKERHIIYEHRSNFFKVLAVLLLIYIYYFIVGHFNDFMREHGILFDIFCYPVYIGLIWVSYKYAYPLLAFVIESTRQIIEDAQKYPSNGHPEGYDARIEKYFNDLLWKLQQEPYK